jgi:hypothetical protein
VGDVPGDLVEGKRGDRAGLRSRYNDDETVTSPRTRAEIGALAGAVLTLGTALLPWHRSGQVQRNGFALARAVDRLDLLEGTASRLVLWAWFAVPALVAAAWLASSLRRPRLVAVLAGSVGVIAVVASVIVLAAPFPVLAGPWVGLVAGTATLVAAAWLGWQTRRRV